MSSKGDWIEWTGGPMPVPPGTLVDIRHRDGDEYLDQAAGSRFCEKWTHEGEFIGDIVAWRLAE